MPSFIRSVLGDVPAADLGVCYAHEHIIIEGDFVTTKFPEFTLASIENATVELKEFYAAGGRTMVDSMPCGAGRNMIKLAEISRQSGVCIVAPTGLHLNIYYPENNWSEQWDADQLARLFIEEIETGIDKYDRRGSMTELSDHRAGVIKIASSLNQITTRERRVFEAAAQAHRKTGAPILTHTENGTAALEQIALLRELGCDLSHVVLSHTDRRPDAVYHREILSSGVKVEFDSCFRWEKLGRAKGDNPTRDLIVAMASEGFLGQIMLGMDAARYAYWRSYGGSPGLTYLLTEFWPVLREAGLRDPEDFEKIFVRNPAETYAFAFSE